MARNASPLHFDGSFWPRTGFKTMITDSCCIFLTSSMSMRQLSVEVSDLSSSSRPKSCLPVVAQGFSDASNLWTEAKFAMLSVTAASVTSMPDSK